ncbi:unnamed protein product [Caenorhabditis brenneri]
MGYDGVKIEGEEVDWDKGTVEVSKIWTPFIVIKMNDRRCYSNPTPTKYASRPKDLKPPTKTTEVRKLEAAGELDAPEKPKKEENTSLSNRSSKEMEESVGDEEI